MPFVNREWYQARVEPGTHCDETGGNTPYVSVMFVITNGEMSGELIEAMLWATPGARDNTRAALAKLGFDGSRPLNQVGTIIAGKEVEVQAEEQEYKGKKKGFRVGRIRQIGSSQKTGGVLKTVADNLGFAAETEQPDLPVVGTPAKPKDSDEEIPF